MAFGENENVRDNLDCFSIIGLIIIMRASIGICDASPWDYLLSDYCGNDLTVKCEDCSIFHGL